MTPFPTTWSRRIGDRVIEVRCSTRADGDFHLDHLADESGALQARRRALVDLPWTMVNEEHGVGVVTVDAPGANDGDVADAIVTRCHDAVIAAWAADCAPIVLVGADAAIGVVHAGWRGLAAGVIDVAADALGEPLTSVVLGPSIGPCCYEFGSDDLARVARGVHAEPSTIRADYGDGGVALDVPAAVRHAAERLGAGFDQIGGCTGCSYDGFSHRVRRDPQRHVVAAWQHHDNDNATLRVAGGGVVVP